MKTETKLVYVVFSEYSDRGTYSMHDESMRKHMANNETAHKFLCEVQVPVVSKADLSSMAVGNIDKQIADLAVAIEALQVKKQQFLAIEHNGDK